MVTRSSVNLPIPFPAWLHLADYKKKKRGGTFSQDGQCPAMATLALALHLGKAKVKT